ncbi:MAG: hypothetical protein GEV13_12450 [Rhodospirillales bacterium]|nr:hypothetical protein [Rhodospirillales bacterium]
MKFGTGGEGGGFVVYASAFVDAVKWANPKIGVKPLTTRGSLDNVPLLEAGTVDNGLVFGEMAQKLFNPKDGRPTQLKVITTAYSSPGMFVVRADSRATALRLLSADITKGCFISSSPREKLSGVLLSHRGVQSTPS